MTAPSGARLPRSTAMPACGLNGLSNGADDVAIPAFCASATFSQIVCPFTVSASRSSRPSRRARAARPAGRRRNRNPPSGSCPDGIRLTRPARRGRAGRNRRASESTPMRPAIASRWMTALVEPPMAALTRMAFSNASRVRICDMRRSSSHHLDNAPARELRKRIAARIDGRDRGVPGSAMPSASTMLRHRGGGAHRHAVAVRAGHAGFGFAEIVERHFAGAHLFATSATRPCPNR